MIKDLELPKYPYLGYSPNLMEYFLIIGYETCQIMEEIVPSYASDQKSIFEPTILNAICSNYEMEMLDNDIILKLLFPNPPQIYFNCSSQLEGPSSSVIFFLNGDTLSSQSKVPFHGFAYIFYENIFSSNNMKISLPKAFCIISQYPFFTCFNNLCKEIYSLFKGRTNEIPLEVLLFNMINFTPSPINFSLNLSLFPYKEISNYSHSNSSKSLVTVNQAGPQTTITSNKTSHSVIQLTGYPILDLNVSEIFNILPPTMVVELLVFNILEFDMFFFSKNLEILNMVMYIIATLNYPCNDSIYLWHILSVSLEDLLNPSDTNKFVGRPCSSMLGINCTYDSKIDNCRTLDSHFIVDLDNKNFFFKYWETNQDVTNIIALQNYIRKIFKDKPVESVFLEKNLKNLIKELDIASRQVIHTNYGYNTQVSQPINFLDSDEKIPRLNKIIQEAFYDFILNILTVFYNNYSLNSTFDRKKTEDMEEAKNKSFFIHYSEDIQKLAEEEIIFCEFFKGGNKYNNYVLNFIQEFKCIELYKVPLVFSEEFIYLKKNEDKCAIKSQFFEIIDRFYSDRIGSNSFKDDNEIQAGTLQKKFVAIKYNEFYAYYEANWKAYFAKELMNSKTIRMREFQKTKYYFDYENIELDNDVLLKYTYLLNNFSEEKMEELFPSIANQKLSVIKYTKAGDVVDTIERSLISQKIIKYDNLIVFSLLIIFAITRNVCNFTESISHLSQIVEMLESRTFFLRKYICIVLSLYYQTISKNQDDSKKNSNIGIMCNFIIINFLRNKNILPNEQMMYLFENFLMNNLKEKDNNQNESQNNSNMEEEIGGPDLENFQLNLNYNYCRHGTKKQEYFIRLADNNDYEGNLFLECDKCKVKETRTVLAFQFDFISGKQITSEIFSPLKLYNQCNKMLQWYLETLDYYSLDKTMLNKIMVNLIFYAKNLNLTYKFLLKFLLQ